VTSVRPLSPCTGRSCVSTQVPRSDPLRRIEPLAVDAPRDIVMDAVLVALARVPRLRVLERDAAAVHAIVRSRWIRAPDDIEVRVDAVAGLVHLRVATPFALRERSRGRARAGELLALIEREMRTR
jgi:uncharacterized protein (DUF1499 family)